MPMSAVVVIGAGVGGLAVAARLAHAGHGVTVLEQADRVGGKLGLHTRDGFRFDTGPSLVTMPYVLHALFEDTGGSLEDVLVLQPVEPIARVRFPDGATLLTSADPTTMAVDLDRALGGTAAADWDRLMRRAAQIWAAVRVPYLESPRPGARDLARLATRLGDLRTVAPHRTLRDMGERYLRDPRLRMVLDRYATSSGSDPRRAPAALAVVPYVEQTYGAWYVRGGLARLAAAIRQRAESLGAVVRTGADVVQIATGPRGVSGVRLAGGERIAADIVVANADAAHVYRDLLPHRRQQRRLRRATPSLGGFVLLLGVRGRTKGLAHHSVLFGADYDAEFDAVFGPAPQPVADPTLYVSVPHDPTVAPEGHEAWFVLVNAPLQGPVDWDAPGVAPRYAARLLDLLAARGLDVRDRLVFAEHRTPADLQRATRAVGGAIYGTSSNGARAAFLRPANRSPVPGLYLVGGSAHPGGGLPLVTLSAKIVADLVAVDLDQTAGASARRARRTTTTS